MTTSGGKHGHGERPGTRGQSSVLGVILVVGMVLAGTAVVVALGTGAMGDVQSETELERAEHSMTLFNSRAAMAALGDSPTQEISFGVDRGTFDVREEGSWLRITHANSTDGAVANDDETVYNRSLGSVVYENGGTEIAYEGGGVWRKDPGGEGMMVSPPEFHYREATLTLPIVHVQSGDEPRTGSNVQITRASDTRRVFPNSSASYEASPNVYRNPVANGTVNITVKSPYYNGWAEYFRTNTDGQVTTFPDDQRVRVTLVSLAGSIGEFTMPNEGNSLDIQGMGNDHPISEFNITLLPDGHYNNMHWSFYADEGNEQLEIHFYSDDKCKGNGNGDFDGTLDTSIFYYNSSTSPAIHEEWQNENIDPDTNPDFDIDCDTGELSIDMTGSTQLEYGDISLTGSDNKWYFGPEISNRDVADDSTSFWHSGETQFENGDPEDFGVLVNHYLQLMGPSYDLTVTDGPGGSSRVDESASTGALRFDTHTGAKYITYLHVTENDIEVDFD